MSKLTTNQTVYIFLTVLFFINWLMGGLIELSYDESYYWIYSKFLSFGYFDHPPMVALFIKAGTILFDNEFGVRLFFNLASVVTLHSLWTMTNRRSPFIFIMLSCALPLIQASGLFALPDTPLLLFSVLFLKQTLGYIEKDSLKNSVFLALTISFMFYSKYHGLLVVILTVCAVPQVVKRKSFWLVVFLSIVFYLPHLYWQYRNDFVSFKFHLTGRSEKHFDMQNILNYAISQISLFGIFLFFYFMAKVKKIDFGQTKERILAFNILGFLGLLFFVSFRNQIEANWTVTACGFFLLLMYVLLDRMSISRKKFAFLVVPSVVLIIILRVAIVIPEAFYTEKSAGRLNEIKFWKKRVKEIKEKTKGFPLVAETYQFGAKVSFEMREIIPVNHFRGRKSHYSILNLTKTMDKNQPIYYMTPKKHDDAIIVETGYKHPIYMIKTTLQELEEKYPNNE